MKNKNVFVFAAHPDDETLGCGATIAKLSSEGHKINLITFTDGESSRNKLKKLNRNLKLIKMSNIEKIGDLFVHQ
mgnify:CR=1 FL=1